SGGFRWSVAGLRVSASNLDRPAAIAVLAWTVVAACAGTRFARWRPSVVVAIVGCVLALFSWRHAAPYATGADMFGYVSQADDWRNGQLTHAIAPATASFPPNAYVPLGYVWQYPPPKAVALYPPGLPLHMAVASLLGRWAIYLVAPVAALLAVWGTYRLGALSHSPWIGAGAATLLAFSPQLLAQSVLPMGDTLATAYWTWACVWAIDRRPVGQALAGALAGLAIVVRPNLAPLLAPVLLCSAANGGVRGAIVAGLAATPLVGWLGWHNSVLYGGALATGYGPARDLFGWAYGWDNVRRYGTWLFQTMSPWPLVGLLASLVGVAKRPSMTVASLWLVVATTVLLYVWYVPWPNWTFSRFLLPAFPAVFVLALAGVQGLRPRSSVPVVFAVAFGVAWQMHFVQNSDVRRFRVAMSRFADLGAHLRAQPAPGVVVTRVHSGSLQHYAGAVTVRWDQLSVDELRQGLAEEIAAGRTPLLVDDSDDRDEFEARFGPLSCWAETQTPVFAVSKHAETRLLTARAGCTTAN
ncbi:MAG TPA: glycosyltransferase family 39 protein, partial [Luteitalea sp.]|nr:glycosyltransferase family 39 protein [Luteitalea sp.]